MRRPSTSTRSARNWCASKAGSPPRPSTRSSATPTRSRAWPARWATSPPPPWPTSWKTCSIACAARPASFDRSVADLVLQAVDALGGHVKAANTSAPFPDSSALKTQLQARIAAMQPGAPSAAGERPHPGPAAGVSRAARVRPPAPLAGHPAGGHPLGAARRARLPRVQAALLAGQPLPLHALARRGEGGPAGGRHLRRRAGDAPRTKRPSRKTVSQVADVELVVDGPGGQRAAGARARGAPGPPSPRRGWWARSRRAPCACAPSCSTSSSTWPAS